VCKAEHDRDINASINLLKYGVTHLKSGRTGTVRTKACGEIKVSMNQEASQFIER